MGRTDDDDGKNSDGSGGNLFVEKLQQVKLSSIEAKKDSAPSIRTFKVS